MRTGELLFRLPVLYSRKRNRQWWKANRSNRTGCPHQKLTCAYTGYTILKNGLVWTFKEKGLTTICCGQTVFDYYSSGATSPRHRKINPRINFNRFWMGGCRAGQTKCVGRFSLYFLGNASVLVYLDIISPSHGRWYPINPSAPAQHSPLHDQYLTGTW